ncbi:MAG: hypothetical protein R3B57_06225 [Phycisphaerales bacterium]
MRPAGGGGDYSTLSPRQRVGDTPNARHANFASGLRLPIDAYGTPTIMGGPVLSVTNLGLSGYAVRGEAPHGGVLGLGGDYAPYPPINTPAGVFGVGESVGAGGSSGSGSGVFGNTNSGFGGEFTVNGVNSGIARWAHTAGTGAGALIEIANTSSFADALTVRHASTQASIYAVHGVIENPSAGANSAAVRGENFSTSGAGIGVWGSQNGSGWGVYGVASGAGRGVFGSATGGNGAGVYGRGVNFAWAGYFDGNVHVQGTLSKSAGSFKIDHPLDPTNKYLSHSFVESPDMKNIYDGVVALDDDGRAVVTLPDYFQALNQDFRYQLTCIGGYAQVYIEHEVSNSSFSIAGGTPGLRVSWQLTGIRKDVYARENPVIVEQEKSGDERGRYLYPEGFGADPDEGIGRAASRN